MTGGTYHVFELLLTGAAVAASAGFVLKGWVRTLAARWRPGVKSASAGGCSSCNSCGECAPTDRSKESAITIVRFKTRR